MKKLLLTLAILLIGLVARTQVTTWIPNIVWPTNSMVVIPVYVSGFDSIFIGYLEIYLTPNLIYDHYDGVYPTLSSNISCQPYGYTIDIYIPNNCWDTVCFTIPDCSTLVLLYFNYTTGPATLIFSNSPISHYTYCSSFSSATCYFGNGSINNNVNVNVIKNKSIILFPNPTTDIVNFNQVVKNFRLYNTYGQLLFSDKNIQKVNLTSFSKGVYIAEMDNRITKIIKQ